MNLNDQLIKWSDAQDNWAKVIKKKKEKLNQQTDSSKDYEIKMYKLDRMEHNLRWRIELIPKAVKKAGISPFILDPVVIGLLRCQPLDHYNFTKKEARALVLNKGHGFDVNTALEKDLEPFFKKYLRYGYKAKGGNPIDDRASLGCVILVDLFKRFSKNKKPHHQIVTQFLLNLFQGFGRKQKQLNKISGAESKTKALQKEKRIFSSISKDKYAYNRRRFSGAFKEILKIVFPKDEWKRCTTDT